MDTLIKAIMSSAAEAELGGLFLNTTNVVSMQSIIFDMGHLQPPTPIKIDNTTVLGVVINIIKRKCTKAVNIRFHWLTGRQKTNILYGYTYKSNNVFRSRSRTRRPFSECHKCSIHVKHIIRHGSPTATYTN